MIKFVYVIIQLKCPNYWKSLKNHYCKIAIQGATKHVYRKGVILDTERTFARRFFFKYKLDIFSY